MSESSATNKRIAKNTLFLYARMFFSMAVSLYTSRIVLKVLGIEDFGIYNVVAGVITMFSFLNASMSSASSRFMAFEIGTGNKERLQKTFSSALTIHLILALCVLLLGETIGLWFLQEKLVIPADRLFAANVIYQFTILSSLFTIMQVPFVAMIMAHEKMDVYAYIEIINVTLKLCIVFILMYVSLDKLITYGLLILIATVTVSLLYVFYCLKKFKSCKSHLTWNKEFIYSMFSFSGWDLYGNASVVARTQGVNMLLNMFFGAALNAASGIAMQVQSAIMAFAGNVLSAIRPQIVKSYAIEDYDRITFLISRASVYTSVLLSILTIPLLIETDFVLSLWLHNVPPYSVVLCRCVLLFNLFANLSSVVIIGIHATGKIKRPSFINGTLYLSVIPFAYLAYKTGGEPQVSFVYNIFAVLLGLLSNIWTLHMYVPAFSFKKYFFNILCKSLLVIAAVYALTYLLSESLNEGWARLIYTCIFSTSILLLATYFILMSSDEKRFLYSKLKKTR